MRDCCQQGRPTHIPSLSCLPAFPCSHGAWRSDPRTEAKLQPPLSWCCVSRGTFPRHRAWWNLSANVLCGPIALNCCGHPGLWNGPAWSWPRGCRSQPLPGTEGSPLLTACRASADSGGCRTLPPHSWSQNHRMVWVGMDFKSSNSYAPAVGETHSTRAGCSDPHPTWQGCLPGLQTSSEMGIICGHSKSKCPGLARGVHNITGGDCPVLRSSEAWHVTEVHVWGPKEVSPISLGSPLSWNCWCLTVRSSAWPAHWERACSQTLLELLLAAA